jgi:hypothetical protein
MNWIHEKAEWPFYCRRPNSLSEELIRSQFWESSVAQSFFYWGVKVCQNMKNTNKTGIFCHNILISWKRKSSNFEKKIEFFLVTFNSDFNLLTFLRLVFKLFRRVLKTCCHLMLNPSWDTSQWREVTKLKIITGVVVQSKEEDLSCKLRVDARNLGL